VTLLECNVPFPPQEAEYEMLRFPMMLPAVCGANNIDKLMVFCGATVIGRLGPTKLNPLPETVACEIMMVCLPVFVTATGTITLFPTCTLPNETFEAESDICAGAAMEINNSGKRMRILKAGLWGEPRHLIVALSLHVLI
jgi:hypothetical protein